MTLSPSMRIILAVAGGLLSLGGLLGIYLIQDIRETTQENGRKAVENGKKIERGNTEIRVLQVRFETRDDEMAFLRKEVAALEEHIQTIKSHVDHHVGSEGHVIAIRRADRIEADVKELKSQK